MMNDRDKEEHFAEKGIEFVKRLSCNKPKV